MTADSCRDIPAESCRSCWRSDWRSPVDQSSVHTAPECFVPPTQCSTVVKQDTQTYMAIR